MHSVAAEMCFNKAFLLYKPAGFQLQPTARAGKKMALRYPFVALIRARRAVLTFRPWGVVVLLYPSHPRKSSLINLSSRKMCDPSAPGL